MKKYNHIKRTLIQFTFVATILLIASCSGNQKSKDSKTVAEDRNDEKFDNDKRENDAQFLVNAAEINLEEIQLGQLAQKIGRTTHVRELGKMIEDAHTKSQRELTALAQSKMITVPTTPTDHAKDVYSKFNDKSGDDFDKAYSDKMVDGHKKAINKFEKASIESEDPDIKKWANASLPNLRTHLDHSIDCKKKTDKM